MLYIIIAYLVALSMLLLAGGWFFYAYCVAKKQYKKIKNEK